MLSFEWASRFETVGYKLAKGKGLQEGWDSKELWKSVEKLKAPPFARRERWPRTNLYGVAGVFLSARKRVKRAEYW